MKLKILLSILILVLVGIIIGLIYFKYQLDRKINNPQTTLPVVKQAQNQLIAGFPVFPVLPGATITSTQHTEAVNSPFFQPASYQAYLESNQSVTEIINWYIQKLQLSGWTISRAADKSDLTDENIVVFKDKLTATVNVEKEDGKSTISIYIQ